MPAMTTTKDHKNSAAGGYVCANLTRLFKKTMLTGSVRVPKITEVGFYRHKVNSDVGCYEVAQQLLCKVC